MLVDRDTHIHTHDTHTESRFALAPRADGAIGGIALLEFLGRKVSAAAAALARSLLANPSPVSRALVGVTAP